MMMNNELPGSYDFRQYRPHAAPINTFTLTPMMGNNSSRYNSRPAPHSYITDSYLVDAYRPGDRQPLSFPKEVLEREVHRVREFWDQKQLYYYLTWSSKMQLIDAEFKHFRGVQPVTELIIFSAELHEIASNAELFVVGVPTAHGDVATAKGARFTMCGFMDAAQIARQFGIARRDLPVGSRRRHGFFADELARCELSGGAQHVAVRDIASLHLERPQQYKKEKEVLPSVLTQSVEALNAAIAAAVEHVKRGSLALIPTLRIDRKRRQIECVPLIPIKVASLKQWMAVAYRARWRGHRQLLEVTSLYTNCYDVVSKAALVSADNVYALHWLTGERPVAAAPASAASTTALLREELAQAYQTQHAQRQQLFQQIQSYSLMLSQLQAKEQQIAALQQSLQQARQQACIAVAVPLSQPMCAPLSVPMPMPLSQPMASPPDSPSLSFSRLTAASFVASRNSSPESSPMPPTPLLLPYDSNRSCASSLSGVSDLLDCAGATTLHEPSPPPKLNLNLQAAEYVPAPAEAKQRGLLSLPTVLEQRSLNMDERV